MKAFKLALVMALSFLPLHSASAQPTQEQLSNSKERGLYIGPVEGAIRPQPLVKPVNAESAPAKASRKTEAKKVSTHKAGHKVATRAKVSGTKQNHKTLTASTKPHIQVIASAKPALAHLSKPNSEDLFFQAWLNKSGSPARYRDGEKMTVSLRALKDCNISIFDYDGKGKLTQIFPNDYQQNAGVKAGETITIGGADSPFEYQLSTNSASKVHERIFIFAAPAEEESVSIAMNHTPDSPFRSAEMSLEQYRKLVNESRIYKAREIKIVQRKGTILTSTAPEPCQAPNKLELSFTIEK
jgi:hypothetical protein